MEANKGFEIDFFPVGKGEKGGDAIAIRFGNLNSTPPDQKVIIIDGGYEAEGTKMIEFIKNTYKTKTIDLVVLTHPDKDHASGLRELFKDKELIIKQLLMHRPWANDKLNTSYYKDGRKTEKSLNDDFERAFGYASELEKIAIDKIGESNISEPRKSSSYFNGCLTILGPSTELYRQCLINSPKTPEAKEALGIIEEKKYYSKEVDFEDFNEGDTIEWYDDETTEWINETSIVCLFKYEGKKILLTGDAGKKGLEEAFTYANELGESLKDLSIFQIPHHGSRKNINKDIIDKFSSSFCIASCPPSGDPHHPSRRLINLLNQRNKSIYITRTSFIHWGVNCPDRNWKSADKMTSFSKIEK